MDDTTGTWRKKLIGEYVFNGTPLQWVAIALTKFREMETEGLFSDDDHITLSRGMTTVARDPNRASISLYMRPSERVEGDKSLRLVWTIQAVLLPNQRSLLLVWQNHSTAEPSLLAPFWQRFIDEVYPLGYTVTPVGVVQTRPESAQGETATIVDVERKYWTEVFRQAKESGNVSKYLSDREISKSTYYGKVKQYELK